MEEKLLINGEKDENEDHNQPLKEPFLQINQTPIYFHESWDTGIGGGLWSTGMAMAKYFQHQSSSVRDNLKYISLQKHRLTSKNNYVNEGISALELGSGNGFLSVCLAAMANDILKEIVVTDMADHLNLIHLTTRTNCHVMDSTLFGSRADNNSKGDLEEEDIMLGEDRSDFGRKRVKTIVMEHQWGQFSNSDNKLMSSSDENETNCKQNQSGIKKFDFIFGSDVAYRDHLHEPLISSLLHFSHEHTVCLIGVTMNDTKPTFFSAAKKAGFRFDRIADHLMDPEFRGTTFGLFVFQKER